MSIETRECKTCKQTFELNEQNFPKTKTRYKNTDNVRVYYRKECKLCYRLRKSKDPNAYLKRKQFIEEREELFLQGKRRCTQCDEVKNWDDFPNDSPNSRSWKRKKSYCKSCDMKTSKKYWNTEIGKKKKSEHDKRYRQKNKDILNKKYIEKYRSDINIRLMHSIRTRLGKMVNQRKTYKHNKYSEVLGCTIEELKSHLEKKFYPCPKTGEKMTWDNYGINGWHIDHIYPLSKFDLSIKEQFNKASHFSNLQPLWAEDNYAKSNKVL
jgi:hypothetical protein